MASHIRTLSQHGTHKSPSGVRIKVRKLLWYLTNDFPNLADMDRYVIHAQFTLYSLLHVKVKLK